MLRKYFKLIFATVLLLAIFSICQSARAETITETQYVRIDTYVDSSNPSTVYNTDATMSMGYNSVTGTKKRVFIDMNSYIPPTATLRTAMLNLWVNSCFGDEKISIGYINSIFATASNVSWNNMQPTWDTVLHKTLACNPGHWANIDVKDIAQDWAAGTHRKYGFALFGTESGLSWGRTFQSDEGQYQPNIVLTYDYVPAIPVVSNLKVIDITKTEVSIEWTTNIENMDILQVNTSPVLTDDWLAISDDVTTDHHFDLHALNSGQKYYFTIAHVDSNTEQFYIISDWQNFTTATDAIPGSSSVDPTPTATGSTAQGQPAPASILSKTSSSSSSAASSSSSSVSSASEANWISIARSITDESKGERWPYTLNMLQRRLLVGGILLIIIGVPVGIFFLIRAIVKKKKTIPVQPQVLAPESKEKKSVQYPNEQKASETSEPKK